MSLILGFARTTRTALTVYPVVRSQIPILLSFLAAARHRGSHNDIYNVLWAVVFGFATLNILSLAARRYEPNRRGLNFGELMAIIVVVLSLFLLGWELLSLFHIFPIKLKR